MPTTLSQLGRVAKAQAKGQHQNQQVTPFSEQQEKQDELKLQKINKAEKTAEERIDPDSRKEKDRRKRRRLARRRDLRKNREEPDEAREKETDEEDAEALGLTIDLLV